MLNEGLSTFGNSLSISCIILLLLLLLLYDAAFNTYNDDTLTLCYASLVLFIPPLLQQNLDHDDFACRVY